MDVNVITIQSQVTYGFCGNSIASFVLRRRGHIPIIINTVQYFSKYKHVGDEISYDVLKILLDEISLKVENENKKIYFLTGYVKTADCIELIMNTIKNLKKKYETNGDYSTEKISDIKFLWICDPVIGDNDKIYIDKNAVDIYKKYIQYADIITPNQFELYLLTDIKVNEEKDVIESIKILLNKGIKIVMVTSIKYPSENCLYSYVALYKENKLVCCKYKFKKYDFNICGTGDLLSSLLLSFIIKRKGNIFDITSNVLNIMQEVITNSLDSLDLHIIENQDIIAGNGELNKILNKEFIDFS